MKPGSILVSSSWGGLIDTDAVISMLKSRKLGGLAIDFYEHDRALFYHSHSAYIIDNDVF
jgi:D-lactate dehydrogenase